MKQSAKCSEQPSFSSAEGLFLRQDCHYFCQMGEGEEVLKIPRLSPSLRLVGGGGWS